jgi:hypothetical protein
VSTVYPRTSVKKASFGCGFEEAAPLVVTPSNKEATGSVIEANLDPENSPSDVRSRRCVDGVPDRLLTGPCDRWRVGIGVTYAAGGASLTGENHIPRAVDDHLLPERQPKTLWN